MILCTLLHLFVISVYTVNAQTKFVIQPNIAPIVIPVSGFTIKEFGDGRHDFNFKQDFSSKYGISLSLLFRSGFEFGLNTTFMKYGYVFDRKSTNSLNSSIIIEEKSGYLSYELLGATPFISYNLKKWTFSLGFQINHVLHIGKSEKLNSSLIVFYNVIDLNNEDQIYYISNTEGQNPSNSPFAMSNIESIVHYQLKKDFNVFFGISYIGLGDKTHNYFFKSNGTSKEGKEIQFNDIRIYNRVPFVQIGCSYKFKI